MEDAGGGYPGGRRIGTLRGMSEGGPTPEFPGADLPTAGVFRRIVATLVDMAVFLGLSAALFVPVIRSVPDLPPGEDILGTVSYLSGDAVWLGHTSGILGLWIALWWCYFLVGWGLIGCTPGKCLLGLRVVDHRGRCPIGASRAALRLVAYMASSVTLVAGHLIAAARNDRRTLHDMLAGTRVVRWKNPPGSPSKSGGSSDD